MALNRDEIRIKCLQYLDAKAHESAYRYWPVAEISGFIGYTVQEVAAAIRYLTQKRLVEEPLPPSDFLDGRGAAPEPGSMVRITADGQDMLSEIATRTSGGDVGSHDRPPITIHHSTTNIMNSTVGELASGGNGHSFSGTTDVCSGPPNKVAGATNTVAVGENAISSSHITVSREDDYLLKAIVQNPSNANRVSSSLRAVGQLLNLDATTYKTVVDTEGNIKIVPQSPESARPPLRVELDLPANSPKSQQEIERFVIEELRPYVLGPGEVLAGRVFAGSQLIQEFLAPTEVKVGPKPVWPSVRAAFIVGKIGPRIDNLLMEWYYNPAGILIHTNRFQTDAPMIIEFEIGVSERDRIQGIKKGVPIDLAGPPVIHFTLNPEGCTNLRLYLQAFAVLLSLQQPQEIRLLNYNQGKPNLAAKDIKITWKCSDNFRRILEELELIQNTFPEMDFAAPVQINSDVLEAVNELSHIIQFGKIDAVPQALSIPVKVRDIDALHKRIIREGHFKLEGSVQGTLTIPLLGCDINLESQYDSFPPLKPVLPIEELLQLANNRPPDDVISIEMVPSEAERPTCVLSFPGYPKAEGEVSNT
ncbi:MAG: hypothetical protein JWO59_1288 [Chloroflexi bacterium]|nr:hypothetical protein [Chloroflexota bacterium]